MMFAYRPGRTPRATLGWFRVLTLALLCAGLLVGSVHQHRDAQAADHCAICVAARTPGVVPDATPQIAPPNPTSLVAITLVTADPFPAFRSATPSRAPPVA